MRQGRPRNDGLGMRPGWSGNETRECRRPGSLRINPGRFGNETRRMRIESSVMFAIFPLSSGMILESLP